MRRFLPFLLWASLLSWSTVASADQVLTVRLTAYSPIETGYTTNAIGKPLQAKTDYTSAAADWSFLPVGTQFQLVDNPKTTYVIDDYGSALVGTKTVDLYVTSADAVRDFETRTAEIRIVKFGSYEKSKTILASRLDHSHCAKMHAALLAKRK